MKPRFELIDTRLPGVTVLRRRRIGDDRGFLERLYCEEELADLLSGRRIMQINRTLTKRRGTVRGMHFQQPPDSEVKLVSCLRGEVYDVAIDLRHKSPTLFCWHAELLSGENLRTLVIPEGFAHGFQALTDDCEMLYLHTTPFRPKSEGGVNAMDPLLAIDWPLVITERSARDEAMPLLTRDFTGLIV